MSATLNEILNSHQTHRPIIFGILNVTPDSFSDGGEFFDPASAVAHAERMLAAGADVIDIGAESTRPGSQRVSPEVQLKRISEVLPNVVKMGAIVSIDTTSAEVAVGALAAGAKIINDVSAGRDDPAMLPLAADSGAPIVLMHMLGQPRTMQNNPQYRHVVNDVRGFLADRLAAAEAEGVSPQQVIVDPGIGFGKRLEHNLALLANVDALLSLGRPVMIGPSRKRFIGLITGEKDPAGLVAGTIAACLSAWRKGATIFRVHDVGQLAQALAVEQAIGSAAANVHPGKAPKKAR